jgi:hypothetical protein
MEMDGISGVAGVTVWRVVAGIEWTVNFRVTDHSKICDWTPKICDWAGKICNWSVFVKIPAPHGSRGFWRHLFDTQPRKH